MIRIQVNDSAVTRALDALIHRATHTDEALKKVGARWKGNVLLSFRESKSPWGWSWARLRPSTISRRRKGSSKPLMDTGRLRNSITYSVRGNVLELGTNVRYASTHQFGARKGQYGRGKYKTRRGSFPIPWGDITARPFLPIAHEGVALPPSWRDTALKAIRQHIERGAR